MEKRKILLVAVSVGIFLVIVLSAAILIFPPNTGGDAAARTGSVQTTLIEEKPARPALSPQEPVSADAADMIRSAEEIQDLLIPPPGRSPSSAAATEAADSPDDVAEIAEQSDPSRVVINVPKPSAPGVPAPAPRPAAPAAPAARAPTDPKPAAPAVSNVKPPAAAPKPAAPAASNTRTAAAGKSTTTRTQRDYWIQTGAFSALIRAEDAKDLLASKGLSSIIDDGEVDGQTWYRVRVGPYTSENEANYWLALVRAINGFDQSQVRSTQRP
jgi:DedD protein